MGLRKKKYTIWLWLTVRHGKSLIGKPLLFLWAIISHGDVSHNQRVFFTRGYIALYTHDWQIDGSILSILPRPYHPWSSRIIPKWHNSNWAAGQLGRWAAGPTGFLPIAGWSMVETGCRWYQHQHHQLATMMAWFLENGWKPAFFPVICLKSLLFENFRKAPVVADGRAAEP